MKKVLPPPACVFTAEEQVTSFQNEAGFVGETIADSEIELQEEAMKALRKAREDALKEHSISLLVAVRKQLVAITRTA